MYKVGDIIELTCDCHSGEKYRIIKVDKSLIHDNGGYYELYPLIDFAMTEGGYTYIEHEESKLVDRTTKPLQSITKHKFC